MRQAIKIFRELVETGCLDDQHSPELYTAFFEPDIREQLDNFAAELDFTLVTAPHCIYLVPNMESGLLGYSRREQRELIATNARVVELYLQSYIIMVVLWMFYGSKNREPLRAAFLQMKDIVAMLDERLPVEEATPIIDWEQEAEIDFCRLKTEWNALPIHQDAKRKTRQGVVLKACNQLESEKLVCFYDEQREIRPTQRLTDLMKHYYLADSRVGEIHKLLQEEVDGTHAHP